ncbi:hypothetical protein VTK56DRAFT_9185 [Thermocarpiscus australiensis]
MATQATEAHATLRFQNSLRPNGKVFVVDRVVAEQAGIIQTLVGDFDKSELGKSVIPLLIDVSDDCLAKVFKWMEHHKGDNQANAASKKTAAADKEVGDNKPDTVVDEPAKLTAWDKAMFDAVDSQMLYQILITANYLGIKPLVEMGCQVVADMIRGKTTQEIREILGLEDDLTPEQREAVRKDGSSKNLFSDLSRLNSAVNSNDFCLNRIKPLLNAALTDHLDDALIWERVYDAVTKSTPPPQPIASSLQQTP